MSSHKHIPPPPLLLVTPVTSPQILIRLRQAVDHPYLVIYSATKREGMTPAMNSLAGQDTATPAASAAGSAQRAPSARATRVSTDSTSAEPSTVKSEPSTVKSELDGRANRRSSRTTANGVVAGAGTEKEDGLGDTSSDSDTGADEKPNSVGVGSAGVGAGDEIDSDESDDDELCGICSEPPERPVSSSCGHCFCRTWWVLS